MVIKINYTSSDIYVSTNVSPVYVVVNYSGTSDTNAVWGQITGTLSNQTDLQNALNAKFDDPTGTTSQYLRGDGSLATFPTIPSGTVTSVGLTMPSAFAVANSPVTSSGTLAVTGAGTADQYVRGDGQLANFPTNGGGGSSVNYYLNGSVSQGTFGGDTYYEMSKTPIIGAGTNFTRTNAQGNGYIASFITDAGDPALLNIPGGNWNVEFYFQASSNGSNPSFYAELYKVSSANVFTLIGSGSTNPEGITNGTAVDQYYTSIPVPQTALLATDRLAVRIFVTPSGRTITLHTEDNNLCEVLTTFSTGLNALNGLTEQVQYFATGTSGTDFAINSATDTHTFNLPIASGTNTGKLSNTDWTTFNNKVGGSGATGQVAYWNGTNSQTGSNNLFWDAANARLGIGTNAPTRKLHVVGTSALFQNAGTFELDLLNTTSGNYLRAVAGATDSNIGTIQNIPFSFIMNGSRVGQFTSTNGNLILQNGGTFTDGGQRLQVYGDAFVKGSGNTSATSGLVVQDSAGTQLLKIQNDGTGNIPYIFYVGHNSTNPFLFSYDGNSSSSANASGRNLAYYNTNTTQTGDQTHFALVGNALTPTSGDTRLLLIERSFTPTSGTAIFTAHRIISTINQTGGANGITRGLYVNPTLTAAADWRSIEWSNNSGWGLYGAGTSANYLGGNLSLSTTNTPRRLNINQALGGNCAMIGLYASGGDFVSAIGSQITTNNLQFASTVGILFYTGSTIGGIAVEPTNERMRLTTAGRLLLGLTAESTFLLDVNGTARVSGATTLGGTVNINTAVWLQYNGSNVLLGEGTNTYLQANGGGSIIFRNNTPSTLMTLTAAGRLLLGTTTESTYLLDVNGTSRFSQQSIFFAQAYVSKVLNSATIVNNSTDASVLLFAPTTTNNYGGVIGWAEGGSILAASISAYDDGSGGALGLSFATGNNTSISERVKISSTGAATFSSSVTAASYTVNDAGNITVGTTTGTKIGTATSQKLSFWNATPIVQPTTAVAAATFVANTSLIMNDTATFDGYTIGQVVKALRNAGLLA